MYRQFSKQVSFLLFVTFASMAVAQNCEAIVLPLYNNDIQRLNQVPADKIEYRCVFSHFSFDVADELPSGVTALAISQVRDNYTGQFMTDDVQIDLNVLSYYQYDFSRFQILYPQQEIYFSTPASEHPYLVLHELSDVGYRTSVYMDSKGR